MGGAVEIACYDEKGPQTDIIQPLNGVLHLELL